MAFMVYFAFFGCILAPLVAMFALYGYIYSVVRRHLVRIAATMPPTQAVAMATVQQPQDPPLAASQSSSSSHRRVTKAGHPNNAEAAAPATTAREGRTLSALINVGRLSMQEWKIPDWKMLDQITKIKMRDWTMLP